MEEIMRYVQARSWLPLVTGTVLSLILLTLIPPFVTPCPAAIVVDKEAESCLDGSDYHNEGGLIIRWTFVSNASGYHAVDGVDTHGDWIELSVYFPEDGCYRDTLFCQGYLSMACSVTVTIFGAGYGGEDISADHNFIGTGLG
jgi:hypothetical protein